MDCYDLETKRGFIETNHELLSIFRQCQLLGISRSGLYYEPVGPDPEDLTIMRLLDEQYTKTPFYGVRKMTEWLRSLGFTVNHKRVRRLLRLMGLEAIYPKPRLSIPGTGHKIYPYLLRGVPIVRPNQVWSADITYVRLAHGFVYLMAIMDWFSRYVISWSLSVTLDATFCIEALERALAAAIPEIFNSDQGSQFTSQDFTGRLEDARVAISMDGRGRFFDNIFVERLWRSVKYEDVYLKDYVGVPEAREGLGHYFRFYNTERIHESLEYKTPRVIYAGA